MAEGNHVEIDPISGMMGRWHNFAQSLEILPRFIEKFSQPVPEEEADPGLQSSAVVMDLISPLRAPQGTYWSLSRGDTPFAGEAILTGYVMREPDSKGKVPPPLNTWWAQWRNETLNVASIRTRVLESRGIATRDLVMVSFVEKQDGAYKMLTLEGQMGDFTDLTRVMDLRGLKSPQPEVEMPVDSDSMLAITV